MHLVLYCKSLISALNDSWNDKGEIRELQQDSCFFSEEDFVAFSNFDGLLGISQPCGKVKRN